MAAPLAEEESDHPFNLREDEGTHLTSSQKKKLNKLSFQFQTSFSLGREATPFIEHHTDTQTTPLSNVCASISSISREEKIMKSEIDRLLTEGIIEPCKSQYAVPVVLIPKPNGTYRFCVDYRKINTITKTDSYPLLWIDDLLHDAKHICYVSTIDLKASYHQVNVAVAERDRTAFICPYGTFCFIKRTPFWAEKCPCDFSKAYQ